MKFTVAAKVKKYFTPARMGGLALSLLMFIAAPIVALVILSFVSISEFFMFWLFTIMMEVPLLMPVFGLVLALPFLLGNALLQFSVRYTRLRKFSPGIRTGYVLAILPCLLVLRTYSYEQTQQRYSQARFTVKETGDVRLCEEIQPRDELEELYLADCWAAAAEVKLDASYCDRITEGKTEWSRNSVFNSKSGCYSTVAHKTGDESLCEKAVWDTFCIDTVRRWKNSDSSSNRSSSASFSSQ